MFRPFAGEVLMGRIQRCDKQGLKARHTAARNVCCSGVSRSRLASSTTCTCPANCCRSLHSCELPATASAAFAEDATSPRCSDKDEKLWYWQYEGNQMFMDLEEEARCAELEASILSVLGPRFASECKT